MQKSLILTPFGPFLGNGWGHNPKNQQTPSLYAKEHCVKIS